MVIFRKVRRGPWLVDFSRQYQYYFYVFFVPLNLIHFGKVISAQNNKWKGYIILKINNVQDISNILSTENIGNICVCVCVCVCVCINTS